MCSNTKFHYFESFLLHNFRLFLIKVEMCLSTNKYYTTKQNVVIFIIGVVFVKILHKKTG